MIKAQKFICVMHFQNQVAGVAALIIEKNGGSMHPSQVEAILRQSADDLGKPGKDDFYGHGRVNAFKAVTQ